MEQNPYEAPRLPSDRPPVEDPFRHFRHPLLIAAAMLIPLLAYLAVVTLYLVEEVRYNAAERERIANARNEDAQTVLPLP
jgi:hypothetical protein